MHKEKKHKHEEEKKHEGCCGGAHHAEGEHECRCSHDDEPCGCGDECACENSSGSECSCGGEDNALGEIMLQLAAAVDAAEKNRDLYMRTVADFDTYKRKVQREKDELAKFAIVPLIDKLLPSLDTLAIAIAGLQGNEATKGYAEGFVMLEKQMVKTFEDFGVRQINPLGEEFDPKEHECVAHQPSADYAENKVMGVMRIGYALNGRLIRPATVVVSKGVEE